ncbi:MAG: hypothetical protein HUJ63_06450 [Enterococcus sp.]|nr:hypothetical protein [Enterococcus sp.]
MKFVLPESCGIKPMVINQDAIDKQQAEERIAPSMFYAPIEPIIKEQECPGCQNKDNSKHNGIYAIIRDWGIFENDHKDKHGKTGKARCDIRFFDIVYKNTK